MQGIRRLSHAFQYSRAEPSAGRSELEHLDSPVIRGRVTPDEAARFEPVDEAGHIGRIARQGLGNSAHRDRPFRLNQVQHMTLGRRKLELRRERRQVGSPGKEEFHKKLPGFRCLRFC